MLNPKSENRSEKARIPRETLRKVKNPDLLYPELSYKVVGAVFAVWKELGPAFKESIYQKALAKEFSKRNIPYKNQQQIPISYDGQKVGVYTPDFIIDEKIILEIKYLPIITAKEKRQAWHYLKGSQYKLLLLVNFGGRKLEIKRWIYDKARNKS